jgi:hypothetical protein
VVLSSGAYVREQPNPSQTLEALHPSTALDLVFLPPSNHLNLPHSQQQNNSLIAMAHHVEKNDPDAMERGSSNSNGNRLDVIHSEDHFREILTKTMTTSPELFEKLYLNPKREVPGDLRKRFANPTPLGIMGFSVAVFPLSIELSTGFSSSNLQSADMDNSGMAWSWRFRFGNERLQHLVRWPPPVLCRSRRIPPRQ